MESGGSLVERDPTLPRKTSTNNSCADYCVTTHLRDVGVFYVDNMTLLCYICYRNLSFYAKVLFLFSWNNRKCFFLWLENDFFHFYKYYVRLSISLYWVVLNFFESLHFFLIYVICVLVYYIGQGKIRFSWKFRKGF